MRHSSRVAVAVHVLTLLAAGPAGVGVPVSSEFIAGSVNTNPVVIRRLLRQLVRARLVRTVRGPQGGALLGRSAELITLWEVYEAVEPGAVFRMPAAPPNPRCPVGRAVQPVLERHLALASQAMADELGRSTIADIVQELEFRARRVA